MWAKSKITKSLTPKGKSVFWMLCHLRYQQQRVLSAYLPGSLTSLISMFPGPAHCLCTCAERMRVLRPPISISLPTWPPRRHHWTWGCLRLHSHVVAPNGRTDLPESPLPAAEHRVVFFGSRDGCLDLATTDLLGCVEEQSRVPGTSSGSSHSPAGAPRHAVMLIHSLILQTTPARKAPQTQTLQQDFLGPGKLLQGEAGRGQSLGRKWWSFENCRDWFNNCLAEVSCGPDPWATEHDLDSFVMTWGSVRNVGCSEHLWPQSPSPAACLSVLQVS